MHRETERPSILSINATVRRGAIAAVGLASMLACASIAGEHPRLLVCGADLPRIRHACGLARSAQPDAGRFGRAAADFRELGAYFAIRAGGETLPGEALGAAFLQLVDPAGPDRGTHLATLAAALRSPVSPATDPLELVIAIDWCWADLSPETRDEYLIALRPRLAPLTPQDSPLDHRTFRERLAAIALAAIIDEEDDASSSWSDLRARILTGARTWFESTFPRFVEWRGLSATGPSAAAAEESDTVLAIELAAAMGEDLWPRHRDSVGRWLEHYVFATLDHPALKHHFARDDAGSAPLTPAPEWEQLFPLTAHLIAARTGDPYAARVADQVEQDMRKLSGSPQTAPWRWVPIIFELCGAVRMNPESLPIARNFGGAVVFRSGAGPDAAAIWIEAGQPFLRRRQHFDAGHFVVYRAGHLLGGAGDDVAFEAIPSQGGSQRLGRERSTFDFEQYVTSSIAHNCAVFYDPARIRNWYGKPYAPAGGQRCLEGTCNDFRTPLEAQGRKVARQLAYGHRDNAAYLALDLTPAYEPAVVTRYTREFVYHTDGVLLVVERVAVAAGRTQPTWIFNLPARPLVDGADLPETARIDGASIDAGVWRLDEAGWIRWSDCDGTMWFRSILPTPKRLRVVGGPAKRLIVAEGPLAGRVYVGGEPDGFERLVLPAERRGAANAWYRLGSPVMPGAGWGRAPHWGRIETEPAASEAEVVGASAFVMREPSNAQIAPEIALDGSPSESIVRITADREPIELRIKLARETGGSLKSGSGPTWPFPTAVELDR